HSGPPSAQLTMTQPTLSARAPPTRAPPRMMKAIDFRRPPDLILPAYRSVRATFAPATAGCRPPKHEICFFGGPTGSRLCRDFLRRQRVDLGDPEVPHQADRTQQLQLDPGHVELVPRQPVPRGGGVRVMVVVPPLAERQQRDPPDVARVVPGREPALAPEVRGRVHQPGRVQPDDHAEEDRPVAERPAP